MTEPSLIEDFADEAREHLEELEHNLLQLASDPAGRDLLDGIFRSMHTIKGASEYLGFERIARLSHCLENLLDVFRDGRLRADRVAVDLLIDARDRIEELVGQVETTGRESSEIDDLLDRAGSIAAGKTETETQSGSAEVSPGEVDRELFTIFIEQLTEGLVRLAETAGRLSVGPDLKDGIGRMTDQVKRLGGTAHYMGFDALAAVYDDLLSGIDMVAGLSADAESTKVTGSLRSTIVDGIGRIRRLFPDQKGLAAIDLSELTGVVAGDDP
ncbi:MAG: Hpt domain-containing protein, partial [Desulfosarcina sp.]